MNGFIRLLPLIICFHEVERDSSFFVAFRKISKSDFKLRHVSPVSPSVWKKLGFHWTDYHEIWKFFEHLSGEFKFH